MRLPVILSVLLLWAPFGQEEEEKCRKLFEAAIEAMGGPVYTAVTDMVSDGQLFYFDREGASSNRIKYNDWTKLPDKSRFEIGNNKKARDVSVFNLGNNEGWILEGQKPTRKATPEEIQDFKNAAKHSLDNLLRSRYRDPQNKLFYLGPGQGSDVIYEMVKLLDPDNDEVTLYFDRSTKLPGKIAYATTDRQGVRLRHVDEFSQWHKIQGVLTPLRTDSSINGRRWSQVFVLQISYNTGLADSFFVKPEPPK